MVKFSRKRIGLIFAGGTILSNQPKQWEHVDREAEMRRWLDHVPELHVVADIEPIFVTGKSASDIGGPEWMAMARAVQEHADRVDGFVILHGLETIHYSANALALMLQHVSVPVVFSASPIPKKETSVAQAEFGARANIINAAQVATSNGADVLVVFGNRIIQGSRAQIDFFNGSLQVTSVNGALLGQVDFGTKYFVGSNRRQQKSEYHIHLDPNVLVTTVMPGTGVVPAERKLIDSVHGVVLRMHQGYSALPKDFIRDLEHRTQQGLAVVIATPTKIPTLPKSFIQLPNVSQSMAVVKTMWALAAPKRTLNSFRTLMIRDVAGEVIEQRKGIL